MATQLFLRRPDSVGPRPKNPIRAGSSPDTFVRADVAAATNVGAMHASRGAASVSSSSVSTVAGPTAGIQMVGNAGVVAEWLSDAFDADTTISGTITFNIWASESSMSANAGLQVVVDVVTELAAVGSTIIDSERGVELGTTLAVNNWTDTPTSTVVARGQRLRARLYINDAGGTMASGFTCLFASDGSTGGASGDTYITFNENITFASMVTGASNTVYYCSNTASDIASAKEIWTASGSGVTSTTSTAAGFTAAIQCTASAGGSVLVWYTKQLSSRSIDQVIFAANNATESSTAANAVIVFELALCESDGSSPTVLSVSPVGTELQTSAPTVWQADAVFPSVTITDGQRLRLTILIDDVGNGSSDANAKMGSGFTTAFTFGGTAVAVTLPSLTEFVASGATRVPYRNPMPQLLAQ